MDPLNHMANAAHAPQAQHAQQPQLQGIHLPEPIHDYPIALGWWLVYALILLALVWAIVSLVKYIKVRKNKKQAISALNTAASASEILTITKWAMMQYFPRQQVASLAGESLKAFMSQQLPAKKQSQFEQLMQGNLTLVYQKNDDKQSIEALKQASLYWLSHALPVKAKPVKKAKSQPVKTVKPAEVKL